MSILTGILGSIASSVFGDQMKKIATEKITSVARDKLGLPQEAPEADIEKALRENPEIVAQIKAYATQLSVEQERTHQIAMQEQGMSERVSLKSDSAYVRNARPTMIYLGGLSCFGIIVFGVTIAWMRPEALVDYVQLVSAVAMPLTALLTAGGVYAYRRTTDKAVSNGITLPSILGKGT